MADINMAFVYDEEKPKKKKAKKAKMCFEDPQEKKPKKPKKQKKRAVEKTNDVCRFFLASETCRFGDKCRNRHVRGDQLSSEGVDPEAMNVILQYLANFGFVKTKAEELAQLKRENQKLKEEIEKSKDTLSCRVCFEYFGLSKLCTLPCGHIYCKECVKRFPKDPHLASVITCPTCNQATRTVIHLF